LESFLSKTCLSFILYGYNQNVGYKVEKNYLTISGNFWKDWSNFPEIYGVVGSYVTVLLSIFS